MNKKEKEYTFRVLLIGLLVLILISLINIEFNLHDIEYTKWDYYVEYIQEGDISDTLTEWGNFGCVVDSARIAKDFEENTRGYEFIIRCPMI